MQVVITIDYGKKRQNGKKANLGIDTMAPLFAPLKDKENVYFVKEYWDYYQSR